MRTAYAPRVPASSDRPLPRVVILMPAYHAGERILHTVRRILPGIAQEIIVVDDASRDHTFALAQQLPVRAYKNNRNLGYGGNMKVCLARGLETDGDVFVEFHADGQYDPSAIPTAVAALRPTDGMVVGSRLLQRGNALRQGMPLHKYVMNHVLTAIANVVLKTHLTEFQSGFRVYTRAYLERVNWRANSNDHLFSLETILQAFYHGFTVSEVPVECTYDATVTQMGLRKGIQYTREMLWALFRFRRARRGLPDPIFAPARVAAVRVRTPVEVR